MKSAESFHFYHVCISNFNWLMWWSFFDVSSLLFLVFYFVRSEPEGGCARETASASRESKIFRFSLRVEKEGREKSRNRVNTRIVRGNAATREKHQLQWAAEWCLWNIYVFWFHLFSSQTRIKMKFYCGLIYGLYWQRKPEDIDAYRVSSGKHHSFRSVNFSALASWIIQSAQIFRPLLLLRRHLASNTFNPTKFSSTKQHRMSRVS